MEKDLIRRKMMVMETILKVKLAKGLTKLVLKDHISKTVHKDQAQKRQNNNETTLGKRNMIKIVIKLNF